jgi:hypothetical protein
VPIPLFGHLIDSLKAADAVPSSPQRPHVDPQSYLLYRQGLVIRVTGDFARPGPKDGKTANGTARASSAFPFRDEPSGLDPVDTLTATPTASENP